MKCIEQLKEHINDFNNCPDSLFNIFCKFLTFFIK